jgi:hypothetical protein
MEKERTAVTWNRCMLARSRCRRLSTKPGWQSTKGYAQDSDLSVDRCASYELDDDARHYKVLSRFDRREGVIPMSCV